MKFEVPATTNPIDQLKVVGKPLDRVDGKLKATGMAAYAYEHPEGAPAAVYGYPVFSAIAKGSIASIDLRDAIAAPGYLAAVSAAGIVAALRSPSPIASPGVPALRTGRG